MHAVFITLQKLKNDSLSRNAFFLMLSTFIMAGIGFFFWTICARLYATEHIGLATTLISITSLITSFSMMGFNTALIRFLPGTKEKNTYINTALAVVSIAAIFVTGIFLIGLPIFSPKLAFIQHYPIFMISLVVFLIIASLNAITDSVFISYRRSEFVLITNTIMSLVKLSLPVFMVPLGAYGIFYSFMGSINVAMIVSILLLTAVFGYQFFPKINTQAFKQMWKFSSGNYIAGLLSMLPASILPLLIINNLGPSYSAYFFMALMIANVIFIIPTAVTQSLFAEGSQDEKNLSQKTKKSLIISILLLIPTVLIITLFGQFILSVFGKNYASEGLTLLKYLSFSSFFLAFNSVQYVILKLQKKITELILVNSMTTIIILLLSQLLIHKGIHFIGIAWVTGQIVTSLYFTTIYFIKKNLL